MPMSGTMSPPPRAENMAKEPARGAFATDSQAISSQWAKEIEALLFDSSPAHSEGSGPYSAPSGAKMA